MSGKGRAKRVRRSAGLLVYRRGQDGALEVFLAHPGGPYWTKKDEGAWTIPKGEPDEGEELLATALREFAEETGLPVPEGPYLSLGEITQKGGKVVSAWACAGDCDPSAICSNQIEIEWPPRTGRRMAIPEVDRCAWFGLEEARGKMKDAQIPLLERLEAVLAGRLGPEAGD